MTTTNSSLDERVTVLETRLDTILPTLATKADVARLETRLDTILPTPWPPKRMWPGWKAKWTL